MSTLCKNCGVPVEVTPDEFLVFDANEGLVPAPFREAFFEAQEVNFHLVGFPGLAPNRGLCEYCDPDDPYVRPEEVLDAAIQAELEGLI